MNVAASAHAFKTIMVVDDDAGILKLLDQFLSLKGFGVVSATTVNECKKKLALESPDLLIVDYSLPDGTGLDIVKTAMEESPDLPVIMMTGVAVQDVKVAADAIKSGAIEYLTKPFRLEVLEERICTSLEVHREKKRKRQSLRHREVLTRQLISLLEKERHHLARELHDEIGQTLTTLKMDCELLLEEISSSDGLSKRLQNLVDKLTGAIEKVRTISYGLRPSTLETVGLKSALELLVYDLGRPGPTQVRCFFSGLEDRFHMDLELAAYRIIQEALNNVFKHAQAANAYLNVVGNNDVLSISLEDDGAGFDVDAVLSAANGSNGLGLLSMQERAQQFNGQVWIDSRPGQGTCISVELPLHHGSEDG
jgi:signal transduction histidine kinase